MNRLKIISLAGLAALDLAAGLFAWRAFSGSEALDRLPPHSAPSIVPAALSDAPARAQGDDPETLGRPLFAKSRRPSQAAARPVNEAIAAPPPAGLKLHAIVGFNHSARAFVTSSAAAAGKWLSVGEFFENWKVDSIADQEIGLRRDADSLRVTLAYDDAAASMGPAPAPPPAKAENRDEAPAARAVAPEALSAAKDARRGGR